MQEESLPYKNVYLYCKFESHISTTIFSLVLLPENLESAVLSTKQHLRHSDKYYLYQKKNIVAAVITTSFQISEQK